MNRNKIFLLCLLCTSLNTFATYQWKKTADCFVPVAVQVDKTIPSTEIEEGCFYMLVDLQSDLASKQNYTHYAYKVTSENGVENNAEINIEYNPAYQKAYLNMIRVYRNGQFIDYKSKVKIKELQRETDLEYHVYDETMTIYIILEDIRIGDIIEYSYTKEGSNPIFENLIYKSFTYQETYTLIDFYLRIIKPENLPLYIQYQGEKLNPEIKKTKNGEEWIWQMKNVPALKTEDYVPGWYSSYSLIEISSSPDWNAVRQWGINVFKNDEVLSDQIKSICRKIGMEYQNNEDKTMAVLRYVQKNIRYLGIEIGVNSHQPQSPNKVVKQGYGDCKDKALLTVKMLGELGIKAYPVLVSTSLKGHVNNYLPAPNRFNHAIVKVELDGKSYWFDPTQTNEGGNISHYYFEPYQKALVLDGNNAGLDTVITQSLSQIDILEKFEVKDLEGNATLNVTTTYLGYDADEIRYTFATSSKKQIQEDYLDFYKNSYFVIDTFGSISFDDDTIINRVNVFESYLIKDFWKIEDTTQKSHIQTEVTAFDINNKLNNYQNKYANRKAPLFLEYPLHLNHTFVFSLPVEWNVKPIDDIIENDYFTFTQHSFYKDRTITMTYSFQTKKDFVPAKDAAVFMADIKRIRNVMSYQLTYVKPVPGEKLNYNLSMVALFIFVIITFAFISYKLYHQFTEPDARQSPSAFHVRIHGWVILPIIGLMVTPVLGIIRLTKIDFFSDAVWNVVTGGGSTIYSISLIFELLFQGLFIVIPIALLILASRFDKRFPRLMIYFYLLTIAINIIDLSLVNLVPELSGSNDYSDISRSIFAAVIWIPFFSISEKCRQIFDR